MARHGIPTAKFQTFTSPEEAIAHIERFVDERLFRSYIAKFNSLQSKTVKSVSGGIFILPFPRLPCLSPVVFFAITVVSAATCHNHILLYTVGVL